MTRQRAKKPSAHATLDQLRQTAAAERVKQRELETQLDAAKAAVDRASDEIAEAYAADDERAVIAARDAEHAAVAEVRELQHRVDRAAIRVERAQADADRYLAEHARELLDEREAEGRELAANLTATVHDAVRLHQAYRTMRSDIDSLVAAVPGATSRADGPAPAHPWERQLNDLARATQETLEVPPPLPTWKGVSHRQQQDNAHRIEQQRRRGELSPDDQADLAIGRVVTLP